MLHVRRHVFGHVQVNNAVTQGSGPVMTFHLLRQSLLSSSLWQTLSSLILVFALLHSTSAVYFDREAVKTSVAFFKETFLSFPSVSASIKPSPFALQTSSPLVSTEPTQTCNASPPPPPCPQIARWNPPPSPLPPLARTTSPGQLSFPSFPCLIRAAF